jgi:hypothetical protein
MDVVQAGFVREMVGVVEEQSHCVMRCSCCEARLNTLLLEEEMDR